MVIFLLRSGMANYGTAECKRCGCRYMMTHKEGLLYFLQPLVAADAPLPPAGIHRQQEGPVADRRGRDVMVGLCRALHLHLPAMKFVQTLPLQGANCVRKTGYVARGFCSNATDDSAPHALFTALESRVQLQQAPEAPRVGHISLPIHSPCNSFSRWCSPLVVGVPVLLHHFRGSHAVVGQWAADDLRRKAGDEALRGSQVFESHVGIEADVLQRRGTTT